jgi:hypothetical protein
METDDHDDKEPGGNGWKAPVSFAEHITGRNTAPHTGEITSSLLTVITPVNLDKFYSKYVQYSHTHCRAEINMENVILRNVTM